MVASSLCLGSAFRVYDAGFEEGLEFGAGRFGLWGSGFGVGGLGLRIWGSGFEIQGLGFRVWGSGSGISGFEVRVWVLGFQISILNFGTRRQVSEGCRVTR